MSGSPGARDHLADQVQTAADDGEVELEETDTVVNMPVLTWPGGER